MRFWLLMLVVCGQVAFEVVNRCSPTEPTIEAYVTKNCPACPRWKSKLGKAVDWKDGEFAGAAFYPCFVANGKPLVMKAEEYTALMALPAEDVMVVLKARAVR